jgi:peptidoglycan hydrolase-like protein with peptidoglycan-binding domain
MNGARVQALQRVLKDLGYFPGIASGRFGPETLQAVKGFQRDNQLIVDGQVGHQTLMVLLHFGGHRLEETT